jgi:hypothetical protein
MKYCSALTSEENVDYKVITKFINYSLRKH